MMNKMIDDFIVTAKELNRLAANKADEMYQLAKLKQQYIKLSNEVRERYEALGQRLCELHKEQSSDGDEILQRVTEIENCLERLDIIQNSIDSIQNIVSCPVCATKNKSGSFYCNHCGKKLVTGEYEF